MSSIGSAVGGLLGGAAGASSGPPSLGTMYPNVSQNSQTYQNLLGNNTANTTTLQNNAAPSALSVYQNALNNPGANALAQGAQTAGNMYTNAGNSGYAAGTTANNSANQLYGQANQVAQMGMDPQSTLYNQQLSAATNSANAQNAANGITGPWAAGTTNQATQNFNSNWQNQQLTRALSALSGAGTADTQAGSLATQGNTLQGTGASQLYQGAGLPYNAAQTITGNQSTDINNLISQLGGINGVNSDTMSSLLQYLQQAGGYALGQNTAQNQATAAGAQGGAQLGGLLTSPSSIAAIGSVFSDERLKENIIPLGEENGHKVYHFNYIWDKARTYIGVLAQEVAHVAPEAISEVAGLLKVDYDKIGVKFREV